MAWRRGVSNEIVGRSADIQPATRPRRPRATGTEKDRQSQHRVVAAHAQTESSAESDGTRDGTRSPPKGSKRVHERTESRLGGVGPTMQPCGGAQTRSLGRLL